MLPLFRKIGDNAEYEYTQVVSITTGSYELKNDYDLRTFPFDKQKLIFKVAQINWIIHRLQNLYCKSIK